MDDKYAREIELTDKILQSMRMPLDRAIDYYRHRIKELKNNDELPYDWRREQAIKEHIKKLQEVWKLQQSIRN